jgi:NADPH-dependent F420 reductase
MQIALLGGTGDIGEGLALRLAADTDHEVVVGSRKAEKASEKAGEYERELAGRGHEVAIAHAENPDAADGADVVVLSVPAYHLSSTIESVADRLDAGTVLVSPAVGMKREDDGMHYNPPDAGSVTALARTIAPDDVPVVGAYHNLPAGRLADLDADVDWDVAIVGDDTAAVETVESVTAGVDGLRPLRAGGLGNAAEVESVTALLINLARHNDGLHDLGVRFQ